MTSSIDPHLIHSAVESGRWGDLMRARTQGAPWSALTNQHGIQALHQAVLMGETLIVKHFLQMEAPVGSYTTLHGQRHSPLWAALTRRLDAIGALLVQAGAPCREADPFEPHPGKREPLVFASQHHLAQTTLALFQRGVNLRDFQAENRQNILRAWTEGTPTGVPAGPVLEQILQSGWYPDVTEAVVLESQLQASALHDDPAQGRLLDRLVATWRQRRSGRVAPQEERQRHGPRERS